MFFLNTDKTLGGLIGSKEGFPYCPKEDWDYIKDNYDRKEVLVFIRDKVIELDSPFPIKEIKCDQKSLFRRLRDDNPQIIRDPWVSLYSDTLPLYKGSYLQLSPNTSVYNRLSSKYTIKARHEGRYSNGLSPIDYWEQGKRKENDFSRLTGLFMKPKLSRSSVIHAFSNERTIRTLTQFKPNCAKHLYDFFGAKRILDPSAGWGDRLVGFLASNAESYIGIDPNTKLHNPYRKIHNAYAPDKEVKLLCSPAEDVDFSSLDYDFVFTSPPYFNLEIYSDEATQSSSRYQDFDLWLHEFLLKTVSLIARSLKENGRIAINISDFMWKGKKVVVSIPLLEHAKSLGLTYEGSIGYPLSPRQGVKENVAEPIFIWCKGSNPPEPKLIQDNYFGV
jgi:hypothetical protein